MDEQNISTTASPNCGDCKSDLKEKIEWILSNPDKFAGFAKVILKKDRIETGEDLAQGYDIAMIVAMSSTHKSVKQ